MSPFLEKIEAVECPSRVFEIYMAGCIDDCKRFLARQAAAKGACWSVDPTEFIYSGGRELGFIVRTINYPRFPQDAATLESDTVTLAETLMGYLGQGSCSIVGPEKTIWLNRRK